MMRAWEISSRETPEHESFLRFLATAAEIKAQSDVNRLEDCVPQATTDILRSHEGCTPLEGFLNKEGRPVIIQDAFVTWPALHKWSLDFLKRAHGQELVTVNDRAPARHADSIIGASGKQRSMTLTLADYINYVESFPESLEDFLKQQQQQQEQGDCRVEDCATGAPFYLNGWRAFSQCPDLAADCPRPSFLDGIDQSEEILEALESTILKRTAGKAGAWIGVTTNLQKVFMGPPGTITRLHYDAGRAHGYLGQVIGRKLFVMYPPSDEPYLYRIEGEKETTQSLVDPLDFASVHTFPLYAHASPIAFVLEPGEAVIIPQGWWHYAVALDRSITVMQNFYHAASNAAGMVEMVLSTMASARKLALYRASIASGA